MNKKCLVICLVLATFFVTTNAAAYSKSCVTIKGETRCASKEDPNGNMALGAASISGGRGAAGAGAGTRDNFNTDYQQLGYGEGESEGYQPMTGQGFQNMNVAVGQGTGTGAFNPVFPKFNGDPNQFVADFFRALARNNGGGQPNQGQPGPGNQK